MESAGSPDGAHRAYDEFLRQFPLCFGYWNKVRPFSPLEILETECTIDRGFRDAFAFQPACGASKEANSCHLSSGTSACCLLLFCLTHVVRSGREGERDQPIPLPGEGINASPPPCRPMGGGCASLNTDSERCIMGGSKECSPTSWTRAPPHGRVRRGCRQTTATNYTSSADLLSRGGKRMRYFVS